MSRATLSPPARALAALAVIVLVATASALAVTATPAQAAKPCWETVIDDWLKDGRIDGVYSTRCIDQARSHLPEDIRAYSNIEDLLDAARQDASRSIQGRGGTDGTPGATTPGNKAPKAREPDTRKSEKGPIDDLLNAAGPTEASSVPLPLIILAALALLLMAAGGVGFGARKLQARRARSRS